MLTQLLIKLKHACPWMWTGIESINGMLFGLRYPNARDRAKEILANACNARFRFSLIEADDITDMAAWLNSMTDDYLKHFNPHKFDEHTFNNLLKNKSFILMKVQEPISGALAGYFFLRGFCIGRAFHGLVSAPEIAGRGLGTEMWRLGALICSQIGIDMYATISKANASSLASINKALHVEKLKDLDDDYMLLRCNVKTEAGIAEVGNLNLA